MYYCLDLDLPQVLRLPEAIRFIPMFIFKLYDSSNMFYGVNPSIILKPLAVYNFVDPVLYSMKILRLGTLITVPRFRTMFTHILGVEFIKLNSLISS
jgi:hypothetical protein